MDEKELEALLGNILDDTKPLPTGAPPAPIVPPTMAPEVMREMSPEQMLEGILAGMESTTMPPEITKAFAEQGISDPMAAIREAVEEVTQSVTGGIFTDTTEREEGATITAIKMPVFTADDFADTMDIRNFATLVTLNTARWHAKVKDRQGSHDIAAANDADAGAFETRKNLLAGADSMLKAIHKAIDEARAAHYNMTLPWSTTSMQDHGRRTGGRLLPNTLFVEYTTAMAEYKQRMLDALAKFEPEYPNLVAAAQKKLGKRFDSREYPNVSSIRQHFDLSFDFQPIPKGDDFKGLPQAQLDALARKINNNTRQMAENAMQDAWMRLHDVVSRMAERLSSPDKVFHDSLVQNVRDTARLLSHLNVTNDAKVEALRKKVEKQLCVHEPKALRNNAVLRTQVAAQAQSIIEEMNK